MTRMQNMVADSDFILWRILTLLIFIVLLVSATAKGVDDQALPLDQTEPLQISSIVQQEHNSHVTLQGLQPKTIIINAELHKPYTGSVNQTAQVLFIYSYEKTNVTTAVRINVACDNAAKNDYPVMFVARQQEEILSWKIPLNIIDGYSYWNASRTLCPLDEKQKKQPKEEQLIYLRVSTMSEQSIVFNLMADKLEHFELEHDKSRTEFVATSRPVYFMYRFPEGVDTVFLKVSSSDKVCMTVSVQSVTCPVMDLDYNVEYRGKHQTMSTQAAMYLQRDDFEDGNLYVVFVVKPNNKACTGTVESLYILPPGEVKERSKIISVKISGTISEMQYVTATVVAVAVLLGFYLAAGVISFVYTACGWNKGLDELTDSEREEKMLICDPNIQNAHDGGNEEDFLTADAQSHASSYGTLSDDETSRKELHPVARNNRLRSPSPIMASVDESEIDFLKDAEEEKDIFRTKTALFVSDLSHKRYSKQSKAYRLYTWNLLTIAIFYGLPAVQLVLTYHKNLNDSGNEDICYYNFDCAHPLKNYLSSFNNVFSNIGYVMLGLLFILIVYRKNRLHNSVLEKHGDLEKLYGIPQYFGLYYAMGFALVMEGVMSASYHVCPNNSNFQFDTSFMYIIACLCMLKIYQIRHPDVNAKAHTVYMSMAVIILVAVVGVLYGTNILWIFYALIHMFFAFALTAQIYFVGRWRIDRRIFKKILHYILVDCRRCGKPVYPNRFVLLFIANAINWAFALYGAIAHPSDFASYLLAIFIGNLLIYCVFYVVMKLLYKERLSLLVIGVILASCLTWGASLYFFFQHLTTWSKTPAGSREGNNDCILLSFYDAHDVWHFLSAISLFLSFLILFMLDDDLKLTRRDRISVF